MIINRQTLLSLAPIKHMVPDKRREHGVTSGMSEAGYDIRIDQSIKFFSGGAAGVRIEHDEATGIAVHYPFSGRFVIASAMEEFDMPTNLVGIVHDKSTWARRGLSVFNTVIEPGWKGFLTLELVYHGHEELIIPAGSGIAQVVFHTTSNEAEYAGRYQHQSRGPVPAKSSEPA